MKKCPECGSFEIIVFDSNNDMCITCEKYFPVEYFEDYKPVKFNYPDEQIFKKKRKKIKKNNDRNGKKWKEMKKKDRINNYKKTIEIYVIT